MRLAIRRASTVLASTALVAAGLLVAGTTARAATGPSSLDFGTVPVGSSESIQFTVTAAPGYEVASASGSGLNPPWDLRFDNCVSGDGNSCTMTETFTPTSQTTYTGTLRLFECPLAGGVCNNVDITLTGIGGGPVTNGTLTASPSSAPPGGSFSAVSSTACPSGTSAVRVQLLDSDGHVLATHAGFLNAGGNWGGTVAVPTSAPPGNAFVTAICDNGFGTVLGYYNFVPVTITSAPPPPPPAAFSVNPGSLAFGKVRLGASSTQAVTVTNTGGSPLVISSVGVTSGATDFKVTANTCSASIAGGGSCHTSVTFKPVADAPRVGTLTYVDNVGTQTVALSGRGCRILIGTVCL
jgi:hypothetical protein